MSQVGFEDPNTVAHTRCRRTGHIVVAAVIVVTARFARCLARSLVAVAFSVLRHGRAAWAGAPVVVALMVLITQIAVFGACIQPVQPRA